MEARDLSDRIKSLAKALQSQEASTTVIPMLESLKKDTAPTEEQLRSTKAGVIVGKLRANPNKDIARLANEIVVKWKKNVDAAKEAKKAKLGSAPNTPKSMASPGPAAAAGSSNSAHFTQPYEGDIEKRHFKTDNVNLERTPSSTRNNSIGVMYNGLAYRTTDSIESIMTKAVACEAAAYEVYKGDTKPYRTRMRALFIALKRKDNEELGQAVRSGKITPLDFVKMTDQDLASAEQRARDEAMERDNMMKAQVAQPEKSVTDGLKCGKCGQRKVSYTQAQTRSADEPMTTFCECMNCGNRWKFS